MMNFFYLKKNQEISMISILKHSSVRQDNFLIKKDEGKKVNFRVRTLLAKKSPLDS